jgi:GTP-binding protein Era
VQVQTKSVDKDGKFENDQLRNVPFFPLTKIKEERDNREREFVENLKTSPESQSPAAKTPEPMARDNQNVSASASLDMVEGKSEKISDSIESNTPAIQPARENSRLAFRDETHEGRANGSDQTNLTPFRAGYIAITGQPNVGKSTLLNAFLQFKLAIVSPKPQTTRKRILGILNRPASQMVFFDTPGIMEAHYRLQQALVRAAYQAMKEADVQLLMVEPAAAPSTADLGILHRLADTGKPIVIAINKIDTVPKDQLLPVIEAYHGKSNVIEIVPISALQQDGVERLSEVLEKYLPVQEPFYDTEQITDHPERFLAAEIVREKIFLRYGEEIRIRPACKSKSLSSGPHKDYIRAIIYVERSPRRAS